MNAPSSHSQLPDKITRFILACAALISFLTLPQLQMDYTVNGTQLVRAMTTYRGNIEKREEIEEVVRSYSSIGLLNVVSSVCQWLGVVTLIIGIPIACFGSAKLNMVVTVLCAGALLILRLLFQMSVVTLDKDGQGFMYHYARVYGFSWGYLITFLLVSVRGVMAFKDIRRKVAP